MGTFNIQSGEQTVRPDAGGRRWHPLTMAVLVLAAALPYLNTLGNGFVYDDHQQILLNPYLRSFHYLRPIFTTSVWSFLGGASGVTNYYRPLMTFAYLLCFQAFGPSAFAFHLLNLLLHLGVVLLVYQVTVTLFRDRELAALAAFIFALHPVHSESVDWIAALTDIELSLFFLAAFWFYLRIPRIAGGRPGRQWLAAQGGTLVSMVLALLSKEQAMLLPMLCLIFEHFYRDDRDETTIREKVARYAPAWLLVPLYLAFRVHFLGRLAPAPSARPGVSLQDAFLSAGALLFQYVGKVLWPARLCAYYVFPDSWTVLLPEVLGGILVVLLFAGLFVYWWRRARLLSFGLVWFLVTLLPVLNVQWMPIAAFAERYLYLPSVGFCWMIAWAGLRLWRLAEDRGRVWRLALASAAALVALLAAVRTAIRNRDWHDDLRFYRSTLAASPDAYVMRTDLGKYYWEHGQRQLAEKEWRAAAAIQPENSIVLTNLGVLLTAQHHYDEAVSDFKQALQLTPDDTVAHVGLGMAYDQAGQRRDAEQEFQNALRLSPLDFFAHNQLGQLYFDENRFAEADTQFRASLALAPNVSAWFGLGLSRWRQGDAAGAESDFRSAAAIDPGDSRVHFMLALLYGADRRYAEAFTEYRKGFRADPDNPTALESFHRLQSEASNANSTESAPSAATPASPANPAP
ncbi:MAG TPA: tetratricopeptide repeat protein [Terriglobia bacterium]|nr:tetratricopeptide repeat protein [Terriglobia bacterium]